MRQKRILSLLWILTIVSIFIVTFINHQPYFIMGGSSSVSPLMHYLIDNYPQNHKKVDFTYNSLASNAAIIPVTKGMFGIGWLSKTYTNPDQNLITFVLSLDGMILIYNLPESCFEDPTKPLNFTPEILKTMYLSSKTLYWKDLFPKKVGTTNYGWVKSSCELSVLTYTRENGSGTRDVFNEKVLEDPKAYYPQAITVNSSTQMFSMAPGGIGYSSYADKQQLITNKAKFHDLHIADWNGITPSLATIKDKGPNRYQLVRPFTGFINKNYYNNSALVAFLKFLFLEDSPIVQTAFSEQKFAQAAVPLKDDLNQDLDKWLNKYL